MATAKHYQQDGTEKGTRDLPAGVFDCEINEPVVHQAVLAYLANQRQGTAKAKGRTDVKGGGKKPYRQKHTGRARHGSRRSPIFTGGGIVFGPKPRDYGFELPRKARRQALYEALSARKADNSVSVVEDFKLAEPKTKELAKILSDMNLSGSVLLLVDAVPENLKRASRNIAGLTVLPAQQTSAYAVLQHEHVVFTVGGLKSLLTAAGLP